MFSLVALLWASAVVSAGAQSCKYIMENYCSDSVKSYGCDPPATTCCSFREFTDNACTVPVVGKVPHSDNYITGSCRTERSMWQDKTQCPEAASDKTERTYYHMMTVCSEGSSLMYCTEEFSDAACVLSKGDKECMVNGSCMPDDSHFRKVTCGACDTTGNSTSVMPCSDPLSDANSSIERKGGFVVMLIGMLSMAVGSPP